MTPNRQTTDLVVLPPHGRGRLTWRNGPASFALENGVQTVQIHSVTDGGASRDPARSWRRVCIVPTAGTVDADIIEQGERHDRFYSPLFDILGWLVSEPNTYWERFEDDDGHVRMRFELIGLCVGRPSYAEKMKRKRSTMPRLDDPDELTWRTYTARDGSVFTFRRGSPPPPAGSYLELAKNDYALLTKKAKASYDAATKIPTWQAVHA